MTVTALETDGITAVRLPSDLNIAGALELHQQLSAALERGLPVTLAGTETERVDAAGLQILTAFVQSARRQQVKYTWEGASLVLQNTAGLLGLNAILGLDNAPSEND